MYDKNRALLHLIGQYERQVGAGRVGTSMVAVWLRCSRQMANQRLVELVKTGMLRRESKSHRPNANSYKYTLSDKARIMYEGKEFIEDYNAHRYELFGEWGGRNIGGMTG